MTGKLSTALIATAALAAAGAAGYLLSEARHDNAMGVAAAPVSPDETNGLMAQMPVEAVPEAPTAVAETEPPPAAPRPAQLPAPRSVPEPVAPERVTLPAAAPEPPPVPAVTSAVPVSTMPDTLGGLAALPVPPLPPPVERIELLVETGSVVGVRLDEPVSSATAKVEDRVTATVTRAVVVDGWTAIPEGSRVEGYVTTVEKGGKFREKARVGLQFSWLVLPGDERVPIATEAVFREGESPTGEATSKIGASAVVGTVLGAIIGGKKGAAIGGAAGAAGGTAIVAKGDTNDAVLAGGTPLTLRLTDPVSIVVERR